MTRVGSQVRVAYVGVECVGPEVAGRDQDRVWRELAALQAQIVVGGRHSYTGANGQCPRLALLKAPFRVEVCVSGPADRFSAGLVRNPRRLHDEIERSRGAPG